MSHKAPDLIKLYIKNCIIGFALSAIFVAGLMWFDIMGLRGLVMNTAGGWIAIVMLFMFNGIVFAGVQFAISIMLMADDDDDDKGHRQSAHIREEIPVPIRSHP